MMEETITEKIARLETQLDVMKSPPPKKFNLPIMAKLNKGRVLKKEWVHVMMIRTNGSIEIKTLKIEY